MTTETEIEPQGLAKPRVAVDHQSRGSVQSLYRAVWRARKVHPLVARIRAAATGKLTLAKLAAEMNRRKSRNYRGRPWTAESLGSELRSK